MKKVLLGVAALSAIAFGANPGDAIVGADGTTHKGGKVGVPLEVRVQILPADRRLILTDETGKLIDRLSFDHGKFAKGGAAADSVIEKIVRLAVADGKKFGHAYKVDFKAMQKGAQVKEANNFELQGIGGASGKTINSKLAYKEATITLTGEETEVKTPVVSTIPVENLNDPNVKEGLYIGNGTFEAELKL